MEIREQDGGVREQGPDSNFLGRIAKSSWKLWDAWKLETKAGFSKNYVLYVIGFLCVGMVLFFF